MWNVCQIDSNNFASEITPLVDHDNNQYSPKRFTCNSMQFEAYEPTAHTTPPYLGGIVGRGWDNTDVAVECKQSCEDFYCSSPWTMNPNVCGYSCPTSEYRCGCEGVSSISNRL